MVINPSGTLIAYSKDNNVPDSIIWHGEKIKNPTSLDHLVGFFDVDLFVYDLRSKQEYLVTYKFGADEFPSFIDDNTLGYRSQSTIDKSSIMRDAVILDVSDPSKPVEKNRVFMGTLSRPRFDNQGRIYANAVCYKEMSLYRFEKDGSSQVIATLDSKWNRYSLSRDGKYLIYEKGDDDFYIQNNDDMSNIPLDIPHVLLDGPKFTKDGKKIFVSANIPYNHIYFFNNPFEE